MTKQEILKSFEGRWRFKSDSTLSTMLDALEGKLTLQELSVRIATLCRDFFEAGICLGEGANCHPIPMSAIIKAAEEVSFDTWWDMYDKKIDRAKCEKKWHKLSFAEKEACLAATPAYVASTPDLQFRRHPMTYLNNKSWENQIIPRNNGTNTQPTIEQQRMSKLADILSD